MPAFRKRDLLAMIKRVNELREMGDVGPFVDQYEAALQALTDDLGCVDVLCRLLTPEQLSSLDCDDILWVRRPHPEPAPLAVERRDRLED